MDGWLEVMLGDGARAEGRRDGIPMRETGAADPSWLQHSGLLLLIDWSCLFLSFGSFSLTPSVCLPSALVVVVSTRASWVTASQ